MIPTLTRLALWWRRLRQGRGSAPLALRSRGSGVSSLLILLPESSEEMLPAQHFIRDLHRSGTVLELHCAGRDFTRPYLVPEILPAMITYSDTELTRWGLPGPDLRERLGSKAYDAVVDLNPVFSPVSACLTAWSGAPLRIGYFSPLGEHYYNVLLHRKKADHRHAGYRKIQQLLGLD